MEWHLALLGLAVLAGAVVQSVIGFGMSVVAAPFVVLVAPELMPVALLLPSVTLPVLQLTHGVRDLAWRALGWALVARLLLTPLGVVAVAWLSPRAIAAFVGMLVLVTVALSVRTVELRPTRVNAVLAGAISGVSGTAAAIGGPFLALVLQHEPPERVRATLAAFFLLGSGLALAGLAVGGEVDGHRLTYGLVWAPFALGGYALAAPVRARVDPARFRRYVLGFCVVASLVVIGRAALA
ncbi:sulfite exporter TauE/SafE family protein [Phycicoccus sp. CSK15P-2]|uniref:sulfite exporter TauE/SafE family protein n=1 Tax=Phycicoccus sp. CSK15P-2 TaxID=2807627 RepID=UPI00194ECB92|nr:sulfite exporter TauE/SafE family protein [Phycicoccus sp. CSK15P-2]MBM6403884.1 sulfite exporter TauE/SafE family protein [Phycicoccus sp. CSK15P-2]